jgi:GntR family transcriptional regulator
MALRRNTLQALYVQLADALERQIAAGEYAAFARLPSERELMAAHQVSRITVRQAIGLLARKGLIEVKQGKGTFVAGAFVRHGLDNLTGFYDSLIAQGLKPRTSLLEFRAGAAAERVPVVFQGDSRRLIVLRRLYLLRGQPFAVVDGTVATDGAPISREQAETHTIYQLLRDVIRETIVNAEIGIRARAVGKKIGALLKLAPGRPVLVMERVSIGSGGQPVEYSCFYIVPETYEFRLNVSGPLHITSGIQPFAQHRNRERDANVARGA